MVKYSGGVLLPTLQIDRGAAAPIAVQLTCAIREAILSGELAAGQRLPSSRTLARDQNVSRTTAVAVFEQLAAEGLIVSRVGAGSYIADALEGRRPSVADRPSHGDEDKRQPARLARLAREASGQYFTRLVHPTKSRAFVTGTPAYEAFPVALWARLTARCWREQRGVMLGYPEPSGLMALRRAISGHLRANRGVICKPKEIFIVNGAQEAFNRIGNTLLDPGDRVWFENPGAIGARNSLISCGAALVPVPIDAEGINVAAGLALSADFRLAFVTPSHQHPTGVTMSLARRFELLSAAERAGAWIVEDDYDGEFFYSGRPLPTLKSVDTSGRVIYVGTFSKSLFPALRIGFMVAPPALAGVFERIAGATVQGVATNQQGVLAGFIEEGHFASHIRRMRRLYAERQEVLLEAAASRLAGLLDVDRAESGFQTIGRLGEGLDEREAAREAAEKGIVVAPLGRFCLAPIGTQGLALGFSACQPREIRAGVDVLAGVLERQARPRRKASA
jgi:GntR family transcriptional regulator/MocR family aminotransferase